MGVLVLAFVVEPTLIALVPDVARFGPFAPLPTAVADIPAEDAGLEDIDLLAPGSPPWRCSPGSAPRSRPRPRCCAAAICTDFMALSWIGVVLRPQGRTAPPGAGFTITPLRPVTPAA